MSQNRTSPAVMFITEKTYCFDVTVENKANGVSATDTLPRIPAVAKENKRTELFFKLVNVLQQPPLTVYQNSVYENSVPSCRREILSTIMPHLGNPLVQHHPQKRAADYPVNQLILDSSFEGLATQVYHRECVSYCRHQRFDGPSLLSPRLQIIAHDTDCSMR